MIGKPTLAKNLTNRFARSGKSLRRKFEKAGVAIITVVVVAGTGAHFLFNSHADTVTAPTSGTQVCSTSTLTSPYSYSGSLSPSTYTYSGGNYSPASPPAGLPTFGAAGSNFPSDTSLVLVPSGNNGSADLSQANTVYWFAAGTHTLGTGQFSQVDVGSNSTYVGAPGAIIDGQKSNQFAFIGNNASASHVTVEYLTIQNFNPPGSQGAVNQNSDSFWTIKYDTIQNNVPGAAMMVGSNNDIEHNCLTQNGQYAFNAYEDPGDAAVSALTEGPKNITISNNEISFNNTCNWEAVSNFPGSLPSGCGTVNTSTHTGTMGQSDGCGCSGGGKFWQVDQATYDNNYVHDNYSVGMWADTNNTGFDVEGNYFSNNYAEAIIYEISYNALFKNNTFVQNAVQSGPSNPGFPDSAIYISESGGDSRVPGFSSGTLGITGNVFTNNYGGVVLWENANRYCSSSANTSTGSCTLVEPTNANLYNQCSTASTRATTPYINDCRWKTQNVSVSGNTFSFNPATVNTVFDNNAGNAQYISANGSSPCTAAHGCGFNAMFSEYGTFDPYSAWVVPNHLSNSQSNTFSSNTYTGPWNFMGFNQGDTVGWGDSTSHDTNPQDADSSAGWHTGFADWNGSDGSFPAQDIGSTFNGTISTTTPPPSTPSNVTATATSSTHVTVSWSASSDAGGPGLGGYNILRNGTQIGTVNASTTTYSDTTASPSTSYNYTVEAFDTATPVNTSAQSGAAAVTTPSSSSLPTVSISSFPNNTVIHGGKYSLTASATPASGNTITQVQLLINGTVVQALTASPYAFTVDTTSYVNGNNTVTVKATDNHGNVNTASATAIVTNGDLNTDGCVGLPDLIILAQNYGKSGTFSYAQGNIHEVTTMPQVGLPDLIVLAKNYGYKTGLGSC